VVDVCYQLLMSSDQEKGAQKPASWVRALPLAFYLLLLAAWFSGRTGWAQSPTGADSGKAVHALFLSDVHLDPFLDPAKVSALAKAPADRWKDILSSAPSPDRQERFDALEQSCHTRGEDASFELFSSSLRAMRSSAPDAAFILISGDLIAHSFSCKYKTLLPDSPADDYRLFVEKTIDFVIEAVRHQFPGIPVLAALGNNDSDCDDYQLDPHGQFLARQSALFTADFPDPDRKVAEGTFSEGGYYAVDLPSPIQNARLLVLDDLFMSARFLTCSGKPDATEADAQIGWLGAQLAEARRTHKSIWVMGHIPPGINPVSTVLKARNVCAGRAPEMFLSSDALPATLGEFADVIQLAVFAHTHMDEMRVLNSSHQDPSKPDSAVPVKLVSSISPIDGNTPSFTVATVDSRTARLLDYRVFAASNQSGTDASWKEEYDYQQAYGKSSYSSSDLQELISRFRADPAGNGPESQRYLESYFGRDMSAELRPFWPQYTCALSNFTADSYKACVCSETGKPAADPHPAR
jgi:sphingomyelin phosphodiesterase acid-like 3